MEIIELDLMRGSRFQFSTLTKNKDTPFGVSLFLAGAGGFYPFVLDVLNHT